MTAPGEAAPAPTPRPGDPDVRRRLRACGLHLTEPRRAVLAVLAEQGGHLSAEHVVAQVALMAPGVHRASVYRSLEALTDAGIVQHVHLGHGATAYHLTDDAGEHLHLQCDGCGVVLDAPVALLGPVRRRLLRDQGFVLDAAHVALSGTCERCRT
ncbi:Fur family transcriptional regulator [Jannaschia sp. R86511]|uniref:Fur family transcriptional regulator n=1 Tax=Jannaschia sp. R86511 TaxID=3093853 RepID=UPI0036D2964C